MTTPTRLRVAIAGAGNISRFHLAAWARRADVEVVAIADPDLARGQARAREFAVARVFSDVDTMLDQVRANALDIASPVDTHAPFVRAAMERRMHALCQKPLCASLAEAQRLVAALPASSRLMIHENWRFRPWYRVLREWIAGGRIGTVRQLTMSWLNSGLLPDASGALPIFARQAYMARLPRLMIGEVLIHHLDTLRWLRGPLQVEGCVLAHGCPAAEGESAATILLRDGADCAIVLEGNMLAHGYPARPLDRCEVRGDDGRIVLDGGRLSLVAAVPEERAFDLDAAYQASFDAVIDHFVDRLRTGASFETNPADNLETLALVEAAYDAARRAPAHA